jgi:hypothetical protein
MTIGWSACLMFASSTPAATSSSRVACAEDWRGSCIAINNPVHLSLKPWYSEKTFGVLHDGGRDDDGKADGVAG